MFLLLDSNLVFFIRLVHLFECYLSLDSLTPNSCSIKSLVVLTCLNVYGTTLRHSM